MAGSRAKDTPPDQGKVKRAMGTHTLMAAPLRYQTLALAAVAAAAWVAGRQVDPSGVGIDDANIVFRYARNVLAGNGVVWNIGEPVEGFSSPLWLALVSAVAWRPHFEWWLRVVSVVSVAAGLAGWAMAVADDRWRPAGSRRSALGLIAVAWVLASPSYFVWCTVSLLETGIWSALLLVSVVTGSAIAKLESGPRRRAILAWTTSLCLLVVTRPEGPLLVPLLVALVFFDTHRTAGLAPALLRVRAPSLVVGTFGLAAFALRRVYFGHWLPNTYYCKIGDDVSYHLRQGLEFFRTFVDSAPVMWLAAPMGVLTGIVWMVACIRRTPIEDGPGRLLALAGPASFVAIAGFVLTMVEGGDHFPGWRPFQPFWPFLFAPIAFVSSAMGDRIGRLTGRAASWTAVIALATVAVGVATSSVRWWTLSGDSTDFSIEFELARRGRAAGARLNAMFPRVARPSIGVIAAGGIGYAYGGRVLDLMGVNDSKMAHATRTRYGLHGHSAFDAATFYEESPDVVIASGQECALDRPEVRLVNDWLGTLVAGIALDPRFRAVYAPVTLSFPDLANARFGLCEWAKKSLIGRAPSGALIQEIALDH